ncbi:MAG TPA: MFS transporter, partial [Pilimelia sp.]|nr:MFS transporter [Pilimelia sp.]
MVLGLLGLAFMLPLLDGTIVCVAMPSIQSDLGFRGGGIHWVMTAYLLSFGGFLPLGIRLCDLLGSRRMFLVGIAVFTAGSLVSGVAWSSGVLVAGRALQGIGAAVLAPTTLPLLVAHFDVASGRGRALALWSLIGASAGTAGYLVGGPLVAGPGWQWIFLVNVPVGAGMLALGPVLLHHGENLARRCRHPLVPLRLLASRTRLCGILVLLAGGVAAEGSPFLLTLYMQQVLGSSPATFGVLMTIM